MGRICAVKNCTSGRYADVERCKRLGLRRTTIFSVPRELRRLEAWRKAIGQMDLLPTDLICERHFSGENIVKEDKIKMPDVTECILPRQKYTLTKTAVPMVDAEKENVEPAPEPTEAIAAVQFQRSQGPSSVLQENINRASDKVLEEETVNFAGDLTDASVKSPMHVYELREDDAVDFAQHLMDTSDESSIGVDEGDADMDHEHENSDEQRPFTIDEVFHHLKGATLLPERWSWGSNHKDETSVIFVHLDRYTFNPRLRLVLHNDLSVTAQTADQKVGVELETIVTSIRNLKTLLDNMEKKVVCGGCGVDNESQDRECRGFVEAAQYTRFVQTPRCTFCRILRRKLLNRKGRVRTDWKAKYAQAKYGSQVKQRACKRLRDKERCQ